MSERWQKDVRKMSECQNYWHTEWLTSMGKTAPPWGRRPVPEEDNLSSTKSICPHESFVFWEIIREFTHSNSSFEYVSDFSNFVFGDVVLFSKCLSHDFFTFSFAFCFFSQPLLVFPFYFSISIQTSYNLSPPVVDNVGHFNASFFYFPLFCCNCFGDRFCEASCWYLLAQPFFFSACFISNFPHIIAFVFSWIFVSSLCFLSLSLQHICLHWTWDSFPSSPWISFHLGKPRLKFSQSYPLFGTFLDLNILSMP